MQIGEVGLLTNDVPRLANFYKRLLGVDNGSNDDVHQFILTEGTVLSVSNDGMQRGENHQNICLAFTVEDVDTEHIRLQGMGVEIIEPPTLRPWGAKNMIFADPDGNRVVFRTLGPRE